MADDAATEATDGDPLPSWSELVERVGGEAELQRRLDALPAEKYREILETALKAADKTHEALAVCGDDLSTETREALQRGTREIVELAADTLDT